MGMSGGSVRTTVGTAVRGTYPPQGSTTDDPLANVTIALFANDQPAILQYGTGSGRFDRLSCSDRAIPAGSSVTYDLYTGTDLLDLVGGTTPLRYVRFLKIGIVSGGDTSGVRVGGAASDEWVGFFEAAGDSFDIFPDGPPFMAGSPAGKAVGASTKNVKIENLGAEEVVVRIVLAGSVVVPGAWTGFWGFLTYP
jgi:hypothetical protein